MGMDVATSAQWKRTGSAHFSICVSPQLDSNVEMDTLNLPWEKVVMMETTLMAMVALLHVLNNWVTLATLTLNILHPSVQPNVVMDIIAQMKEKIAMMEIF